MVAAGRGGGGPARAITWKVTALLCSCTAVGAAICCARCDVLCTYRGTLFMHAAEQQQPQYPALAGPPA